MYQRIIGIKNEIEFLKVKQLLEANEIPVMSNQIQDSAFPVLDNKRNAYQLIIPEEFSSKYFRIIESDYPNKIIEIEQKDKNPRTKLWFFLMIGYGLIMSFLFLKYFDINRKNSSDKNFNYQWSLDNTELSLVNKESKKVSAIYMDKNFDLNYEKTLGYFKGKIVSESIDKDENGIYEEIQFFDLKGNSAGKSLDTDQDGIYETSIMVLENEEEIVFEDKNANGLYEIKK